MKKGHSYKDFCELEVAFSGRIKMMTPDLSHKNGYEILLEVYDEDTNDFFYMRIVLCINSLSFVEDEFQIGDDVYINGTLIFNSEEDGFGDPRLLLLVKNFIYLEED